MESLQKIVRIFAGNAWKAASFKDQGKVPIIRIQNIGHNKRNEFVYWDGQYDKSFLVKKGDLLLSLSGSIKLDFWDGPDGLLNQRIVKIIPEKGIDTKWLYYQLKNYVRKIELLGNHALVNNVSLTDLRDLKLNVPSYPDQIHIANILSKAEALISQRKESLRLLDEFLKSTFLEMFGDNKKIDGTEYLINDLKSGGNETFSNGPFGSDLLTSELTTEGIPVVYIRDIRNGEFKWKSDVYVKREKANSLQNCQVEGDDILIAKVGDPPGISAVYPKGLSLAIITQDVIRIRLNQKIILPKYFSFFLNSDKGQQLIKKISIEGTRNRFPLGDFKKTKVFVPDLNRQTQFAHIVEKTEALKAHYQTSLQELENLYGSLSQRAFRGELGLKDGELEMAAEPREK